MVQSVANVLNCFTTRWWPYLIIMTVTTHLGRCWISWISSHRWIEEPPMIIVKSRFTSQKGVRVQEEEWNRSVDRFWYNNEYTRECKEDNGSSFSVSGQCYEIYKKKLLFQITQSNGGNFLCAWMKLKLFFKWILTSLWSRLRKWRQCDEWKIPRYIIFNIQKYFFLSILLFIDRLFRKKKYGD